MDKRLRRRAASESRPSAAAFVSSVAPEKQRYTEAAQQGLEAGKKRTEKREGETGGVIEYGVIEYGCRLIASVAMVAKICSIGDHFAVAPVKAGRTAAQDARITKLVNATASRMPPPPADDPRLSGSTQANSGCDLLKSG